MSVLVSPESRTGLMYVNRIYFFKKFKVITIIYGADTHYFILMPLEVTKLYPFHFKFYQLVYYHTCTLLTPSYSFVAAGLKDTPNGCCPGKNI